MKQARLVALSLVLVAAVGAAGFWAGRVALEPPTDPLDVVVEPASYVVDVGSVGRSLNFTALAEWELGDLGQGSAVGVVTSVELPDGAALVGQGDVVFSVGLRPVVVAEGLVPMFRSLGLRDEGADVAQLQMLLSDLGFFTAEADGVFGTATRTAVRDWQESLGLERSGVVQAGDIVFVPGLPARVVVSQSVWVGARLFGGETVLQLVPDEPRFWIRLSPEQSTLVPLSADVRVQYGEGVWEARIERALEQPEFGWLDLILVGADGGPVCGDVCESWVLLDDRNDYRAEIIVIPRTDGPVVPVAAIGSGPGGNPFVTLEDGSTVPIRIIESANGIAVVEGVEPGTVILLPVAE